MNVKKAVRCQRCGKRLRKGGDNYRLECTIASDFDGYLSAASKKADIQEIIDDIEVSDLTEQELQEQVYFNCNHKLCFDCRNTVVDYLKGFGDNE